MSQITVLMSVYNGEAYLTEAVESILGQSFSDFIFLIVDDASTDATPAILAKYAAKDSRIRIIRNECNLGLTASLNKGLALIDTPYTARMDADDISLPERLEKQLACMEKRPEIVALGCWIEAIDALGDSMESPWGTYIRQYMEPMDIQRALLLGKSVLVHPSLMLRTAALKAIGGYSACLRYAQDYDLLLRLLSMGELLALPEILLRYRIHDRTLSATKEHEQRIANVSALSAALIRERGEADPLQNCTEVLDYNRMAQLADSAGAIAWVHWLEYNSYGDTELTDNELRVISDRITGLAWYNGTAEYPPRNVRGNDLWISYLYNKISEQRPYNEALQRQVSEQLQHIEALQQENMRYLLSKSWRLTAPLRKLALFLRVLRNNFQDSL